MRGTTATALLTLAFLMAATVSPRPAQAGQSAIPAAFADIGLGARIMGMGGAGAAGTGRAIDVAWNPAGLARLERHELGAMQTEQFGLVPAYLLVGARHDGGAVLGAGILSSGDGLLRENTLLIAAGRDLIADWGLAGGLVVKLRHASFGPEGDIDGIEGSAYGASLGLGLIWGGESLRYGLNLGELVGDLRWDSSGAGRYHESVPPTCTFGLRYARGILEMMGDLELALESERTHKAALGLEWRPFDALQLRCGMKQRLDAEALRFLALGAGISHDLDSGGRLQLDSAYLFHELGGSLRLSASYAF